MFIPILSLIAGCAIIVFLFLWYRTSKKEENLRDIAYTKDFYHRYVSEIVEKLNIIYSLTYQVEYSDINVYYTSDSPNVCLVKISYTHLPKRALIQANESLVKQRTQEIIDSGLAWPPNAEQLYKQRYNDPMFDLKVKRGYFKKRLGRSLKESLCSLGNAVFIVQV